MRVSHGINIHTRERVLSASNADEANPEFWREFRNTIAWKRFVDKYVSSGANLDRIAAILNTMYGEREYYTLDEVTDVFVTSINSGGISSDPLERRPVEIIEPVEEQKPVPVDRNGRPLSTSQIAWGEMTRWSEAPTTSSAMIKERIRTEPGYAEFARTNMRRQMNEEPVDGDARPLNPHLNPQAPPTPTAMKNERLVEFASRWRTMPAEAIKKAKRFDINPLTAQGFIDDEAQAIKLRLL
jgi:hypothetical protein